MDSEEDVTGNGLRQAAESWQLDFPTMTLVNIVRSWLLCIFKSSLLLLRAFLPSSFGSIIAPGEARRSKKATRMPRFYHDDPAWADVEPLAQDDGGMHPLAAIAYTDEYSEAMGYLRAVMANNEFSERVLGLTEHIISMNPAHYTVWYAMCTHKHQSNLH
jgi:protein farnesyltransferase/geranylgeranyltransferase type-1 subunit alpha